MVQQTKDNTKVFEIPGVDTIMGLVGSPPDVIRIPYSDLAKCQYAIADANHVFVALIPYCYVCKVPLIWMRNNDDRIFRCPQCSRLWVKGDGWGSRPKAE